MSDEQTPQQLARRAEEALRAPGGDPTELLALVAELERHSALVELAGLVRRKELLERAWRRLRREGGDPVELLALARELKRRSLFGAARRLLARARRQDLGTLDPATRVLLVQQHALCTYKDPDLPAYRALDDALKILNDDAELASTRDPETLGLAGAIFKRKWQTDGSKQHLETALAYYLRGWAGDPELGDVTYPGINAAYILDQLAQVENDQALETTGSPSPSAEERRAEARRLRRAIIERLEPTTDDDRTDLSWWTCATLAEAHFGLGPSEPTDRPTDQGHYARALHWVRRGMTSHGDELPKWEFETTARQLAALAQLQGAETLVEDAWQVVRQLVGPEHAEALVGSVFAGKLGLGLSGGGFRASLFHIGVFARLAELDLLRHVEVLSCVSGGSILGAYYYLKLRRLLEEKNDAEIGRDDYIELVQQMARDFLAGVQRNLRTRVAGSLARNLKMALSDRYSRTDRLAELYEHHLYALVGRDQDLTLDELVIRPKGLHSFSPADDNWRRRNKVPGLVLNATSLNTGHNWQFTTAFMGESAFAIDEEIDGNWLLRRVPYHEAPLEHRKISLGKAVGASACVPGLFAPVALRDLYPRESGGAEAPEMVVQLVDGGVHDNQGVVSLLEQGCSAIVISDASGQMTSDPAPRSSALGAILRTNSVLMERVRQSQYQDLKARLRAGLLKCLTIVHMKKAFDVEPIDWRTCDEPPEERDETLSDLLPYGVRKELQALLAGSRTDLDSFSDTEAWALMTSGYLMTKHYADELVATFDPRGHADQSPADWVFLRRMAGALGYTSQRALADPKQGPELEPDDADERRYSWVKRNLSFAGRGAFRVFGLSPSIRIGSALLVAAVVAAVLLALTPRPEVGSLLAVSLIFVRVILVALLFGPWLLRRVVGVVVGTLGWLAAQLHLRVFDREFLRRGRLPDDDEP